MAVSVAVAVAGTGSALVKSREMIQIRRPKRVVDEPNLRMPGVCQTQSGRVQIWLIARFIRDGSRIRDLQNVSLVNLSYAWDWCVASKVSTNAPGAYSNTLELPMYDHPVLRVRHPHLAFGTNVLEVVPKRTSQLRCCGLSQICSSRTGSFSNHCSSTPRRRLRITH